MEILYLSEQRRISISLENLDNLLAQSANYMVVPIGFEVVKAAAGIDDVPELHDRLIAGTAAWLGVPILTNDPVLTDSQHVETVWN